MKRSDYRKSINHVFGIEASIKECMQLNIAIQHIDTYAPAGLRRDLYNFITTLLYTVHYADQDDIHIVNQNGHGLAFELLYDLNMLNKKVEFSLTKNQYESFTKKLPELIDGYTKQTQEYFGWNTIDEHATRTVKTFHYFISH